jgi:hypothetical protein
MFLGYNIIDKKLGRAVFWKFLHNFTNAKEMKLNHHLEDVAVVTAAERTELLRPFENLGRLELKVVKCIYLGYKSCVKRYKLFICSMLLRILFYFLLWSRKRGHRKDQ